MYNIIYDVKELILFLQHMNNESDIDEAFYYQLIHLIIITIYPITQSVIY